MKKLVTSYTFDASEKTITSDDFTSLEKIQLITNVTDQIIIYNFADTTKGGTLASTVLTLEYDTTSMADADKLQIFVDDPTVVQPVSAASLPLPTGAATAANQTTLIGHVDGIESVLGTIDTDTSNISTKIDTLAGAVSGTEVQADIVASLPAGDNNIGNVDIASAIPAGTNLIGKVGIDQTTPGTTNKVSLGSDVVTVDLGANNDVTVTGTVTANLSATDNAVLDDIAANQTDASQKTQIVDGSGNVIGATSNALDVNIKSGASSGTEYAEGATDASITGTAILWEDTSDTLRPVSAAKPLPVSVTGGGDATAANQTTIIGHVDGIETLLGTIDTDTSNLSTKIDTIAGAVAGTEMQVDIVSGAVTANAGTNLNTSALALETGGNLASIKTNTDKIPALGQALAAASVPVVLPAAQITSLTPPAAITGFATSAKQDTIIGHVDGIETLIGTSNTSLSTIAGKDFATQTTLAAMNAKMVSGTDIGDVTINNGSGAGAVNIQDGGNSITVDGTVAVTGTFWQATQPVSLASVPSHAVTNTGTFATQVTSISAGNNNIGDVDIASIAAGDNNIGNVDLASAIPAGTNAIGKLLPSDVDVTAHTNYVRKYYTSAGAATDGIIWSPAAGKRWHVVTMYIQTSADATITLEDDKAGGDDPVWKGEIAGKSGVVLSFTEKYPMASGEDAADLLVTTSAGNVYITCVGYEI